LGPIFPFPEDEKKLDFSPSLVEINRPIRKMVGTATNKRLAMKPKLVVSMNAVGYLMKLSPTHTINLILTPLFILL